MTPHERARAIIEDMLRRSDGEFEIAEHIRMAVWAEREACALLAVAQSCECSRVDPDVGCAHSERLEHVAASRIAAAIRARNG